VQTRRPLAILVATALAGLGLTALAAPANADTTVTIGGTWSDGSSNPNTFIPTGQDNLTGVTLYGTVSGTELMLTIASNAKFGTDELGVSIFSDGLTNTDGESCSGNPTPCAVNHGTSSRFSIATTASETNVILATSVGESEPVTYFIASESGLFKVSYMQAPTSARSTSAPAPVIQQFEKPATGTCDEAQPEGLNWGGASSGGWGESWAQWMHEGQGGAVCTRTLAYNNSTASWQVQ